jgi:hypothetical protein
VAGPRRRPVSIRVLAVAISVAAVATFVAPDSARAQGLFDLLLGALRGAAPRAYNREPPRLLENFPRMPGEPGEEGLVEEPSGGPHVAYCVRTCDGRYFPMPASSRGQNATPANLCSSMCPAAETKVYSGSSITGAVTNDGKPYKSLKNAFLYRDKLVADCSCNGRDTNGIARLDPKDDPTLRPGDIVVTADGPLIFKGSRSAKRAASDFVAAEDDRTLPKSVRSTLSEMRIAPMSPVATAKSEPIQVDRPALSTAPDGDSTMQGAQKPAQN